MDRISKIKMFCSLLDLNNIEYVILGSFNLYLKELLEDYNDIDIGISAKNYEDIETIFYKYISLKKEDSIILNFYDLEIEVLAHKDNKFINSSLEDKDYFKIIKNNYEFNLMSNQKLLKIYKKVYKNKNLQKHKKRIEILEKNI